jgi:hypothetical protein
MCSGHTPLRVWPQLGARPGGPVTVVVSDVREELVGYVNGQPYMRRELEMPSAALHHAGARPGPGPLLCARQLHGPGVRCVSRRPASQAKPLAQCSAGRGGSPTAYAAACIPHAHMRGRGARARAGIQAVKLEELERRLRNDIVHEALAWGGRVLLHREVPRSQAFSPLASPTAAGAGAATPGAARGNGAGAGGVGDSERAWSVDDAGLGPGVAKAGAADSEDVTRQQEDECVAAFWEPTGAPRALRLAARSADVCTRAATRAQPCCAAQVATWATSTRA